MTYLHAINSHIRVKVVAVRGIYSRERVVDTTEAVTTIVSSRQL